MNWLLLFPFSYFCVTRLSRGTVAFHALFEWLAAILVVAVVGSDRATDLAGVLLSYGAFISLYELGYLANDRYAAHREADGRTRGPQEAGREWVFAWIASRLAAFALFTWLFQQWANPGWWLFFGALAIVFALHNWTPERERKVPTFLWLAWFRFMAPAIFVLPADQRMGVGVAAAMVYVGFRQLGYLDSKGLLAMPGRRESGFRRRFFLVPLAGAMALAPYAEARGFVVLCIYWSVIALAGSILTSRADPA